MYNNLFFSIHHHSSFCIHIDRRGYKNSVTSPNLFNFHSLVSLYIHIRTKNENRKFRITESTLPIQSYDRKPALFRIERYRAFALCWPNVWIRNIDRLRISPIRRIPRHFQRFEFGSGTGTNGVCHEKREGNVSLARERPFHRLDSCSGLCISVRGRDLTRRGEPLPSTRIRPTPWRISRRVPNLTASLFHPSRKRRPAFVFGC